MDSSNGTHRLEFYAIDIGDNTYIMGRGEIIRSEIRCID